MNADQEERLVMALEMMATALVSIGKTYDLQYYKAYPPTRQPRDIQISRPPTDEEKLRAEQGATGEPTTEDWMKLDDREEEIGPYERKGMEAEERRKREAGGTAVGAGDARHRSETTPT